MVGGFSHVMVYVTDVERGARWYREMLGFEEVFVAPHAYASMMHEGMGLRLDLHHAQLGSPNVGHGAVVYFKVADVEGTIEELKRKGIATTPARTEGASPKFATFQDMDGNVLGVEEGAQIHG